MVPPLIDLVVRQGEYPGRDSEPELKEDYELAMCQLFERGCGDYLELSIKNYVRHLEAELREARQPP